MNLETCLCRYEELEKEHKRQAADNEQELRSLRNKQEATIEFLKQERNIATVKVSTRTSDA